MRPDGTARFAWRLAVCAIAAGLPLAARAADNAVEVDLGALDALAPHGAAETAPVVHLQAPPGVTPVPAGTGPTATTAHLERAAPAATVPPPAAGVPVVAAPATPRPPAERRLAAVPPPALPVPPAPGGTLLFAGTQTLLSAQAKATLDMVAGRLGADPHLYLLLDAYAGLGGNSSAARRLSLSRALAARVYLLDHGVEPKQVDVRPLGNTSKPDRPPDRIDLDLLER